MTAAKAAFPVELVIGGTMGQAASTAGGDGGELADDGFGAGAGFMENHPCSGHTNKPIYSISAGG